MYSLRSLALSSECRLLLSGKMREPPKISKLCWAFGFFYSSQFSAEGFNSNLRNEHFNRPDLYYELVCFQVQLFLRTTENPITSFMLLGHLLAHLIAP